VKIGILTFHWGTNYGGVLQAYALQHFLSKNDFDVQIINFAPHTFRDSFLKCFYSKHPKVIVDNLKDYCKENNINKFRKKHLQQTKRYFTPEQLMQNPPEMAIYISGSDQVWNPYGLKSNGKSYFLPFGSEKIVRISYAASFGVTDYPNELLEQIKPLLNKFRAISVREKSGLDILKKIGINGACLMPDPTLLLSKQDYENIIQDNITTCKSDFFFYVLQNNQNIIANVYNALKQNKAKTIIHTGDFNNAITGIENWLSNIQKASFVVTNSFHGAVFSIIFNTPFLVVPIEGRLVGMNDRIVTLLEKFELQDRIMWEYDDKKIFELLDKPVDWEKIKQIQVSLQNDAKEFFIQNIP